MFELTAADGRSVTLGGTFDVWGAFGAAADALKDCPLLTRMAALDGEELTEIDLAALKAEVATLDKATLPAELRDMLSAIVVLADGGGDPVETDEAHDAVMLAAAISAFHLKHAGSRS